MLVVLYCLLWSIVIQNWGISHPSKLVKPRQARFENQSPFVAVVVLLGIIAAHHSTNVEDPPLSTNGISAAKALLNKAAVNPISILYLSRNVLAGKLPSRSIKVQAPSLLF